MLFEARARLIAPLPHELIEVQSVLLAKLDDAPLVQSYVKHLLPRGVIKILRMLHFFRIECLGNPHIGFLLLLFQATLDWSIRFYACLWLDLHFAQPIVTDSEIGPCINSCTDRHRRLLCLATKAALHSHLLKLLFSHQVTFRLLAWCFFLAICDSHHRWRKRFGFNRQFIYLHFIVHKVWQTHHLLLHVDTMTSNGLGRGIFQQQCCTFSRVLLLFRLVNTLLHRQVPIHVFLDLWERHDLRGLFDSILLLIERNFIQRWTFFCDRVRCHNCRSYCFSFINN